MNRTTERKSRYAFNFFKRSTRESIRNAIGHNEVHPRSMFNGNAAIILKLLELSYPEGCFKVTEFRRDNTVAVVNVKTTDGDEVAVYHISRNDRYIYLESNVDNILQLEFKVPIKYIERHLLVDNVPVGSVPCSDIPCEDVVHIANNIRNFMGFEDKRQFINSLDLKEINLYESSQRERALYTYQ